MQSFSLRWVIGIAALIIVVGLLLFAFNNSSYLKSQALLPADDAAAIPDAAVDAYTLVESYCVQTDDPRGCLEEAQCGAEAERCLNACQTDNEECRHACTAAWDFCGTE